MLNYIWAGLIVIRSVPAGVMRFADLAFPVYLVHPLVHHLILRTHVVDRGTYGLAISMIVFSVAAAWAIVRVPVLRRFAGAG